MFLNKRIANQLEGVIMVRTAWIIAFFLILSPSSFLLAGTNYGMKTVERADQAAAEPVSNHQFFANAGSTKEMVPCTEPRPQVCTQDYRPVCAELQDGSFKTFSNGCSACSDPAVTGYRDGACE
jgi:hypothetical protein